MSFMICVINIRAFSIYLFVTKHKSKYSSWENCRLEIEPERSRIERNPFNLMQVVDNFSASDPSRWWRNLLGALKSRGSSKWLNWQAKLERRPKFDWGLNDPQEIAILWSKFKLNYSTKRRNQSRSRYTTRLTKGNKMGENKMGQENLIRRGYCAVMELILECWRLSFHILSNC